jgi:cell division septation protein DedD
VIQRFKKEGEPQQRIVTIEPAIAVVVRPGLPQYEQEKKKKEYEREKRKKKDQKKEEQERVVGLVEGEGEEPDPSPQRVTRKVSWTF